MIYKPHDYQTYATNFILDHPVAAVFLDMGLGKSVITLTAIYDLCLDSFLVRKVLVIAPLRVARDTWPTEIQKWDHLKGLTYSVAVGTEAERIAALQRKAHVYIINRENVQWLVEESGVPFDFDMVVIDELSSFKSYQAKRFRSLLKVRPQVKRIVGLTGTPSTNGLMDLWAEFRILDLGKRLSGSRETPVWCMVFEDMDYEVEADTFANQQKNVKPLLPFEIFKANLEAGNDMQLMIKALVESMDLVIGPTKGMRTICAISTIEEIWLL